MKKGLTYLLVAGVMVASLATVSFAMKTHEGMIKGEVTKIDGEMVTVKDAEGEEHMLHVDPESSKKEGEITVGAMVEADADDKGHAKSIKVEAMKEMDKDMKK
ncbi:MAG: hypothetical protein HY037_01645 [Nitrospirae bacterium]|nr:hypothetical protein [Candidatus Troglogloeales bacterium]